MRHGRSAEMVSRLDRDRDSGEGLEGGVVGLEAAEGIDAG